MNNEIKEEIISKQLAIAKELLINATKNPRLSKYISEDMIEEAISKVYIAKSVDDYQQRIREENIKAKEQYGEEIEEDEINQEKDICSMGLYFESTGCILINYSENEEEIYKIIIHEIVHYLSVKNKKNGIRQLGQELAEEDSNWNGVKPAHIDTLNESITQYITRMILGKDIRMGTNYDYGVEVLELYTEATNGYEEENNNILEAYFNKNKEALMHISSDFNLNGDRMWQDILKSCLAYDVAVSENKFYFLKYCIRKEDIEKHMEKISTMYTTRSADKIDDKKGVVTEEKYGQIYEEESVITKNDFFRWMREYFKKRDRDGLSKD